MPTIAQAEEAVEKALITLKNGRFMISPGPRGLAGQFVIGQ